MHEIPRRAGLRNDFVVSKDPVIGLSRNCELNGWCVGYGDGYVQTRILDKLGQPIGVLFGAVIDFASSSFKPASITVAWLRGGNQKSLEDCLYERAGSWFAVIVTDEFQSLYLDACGSIPAVYFEDRQLLASSAGVLLNDKEYFDDLYDEAKSEFWFKADRYHTAGLTAHRSLKRLLPNHRLNLDAWSIERIWPHEPFSSLDIGQVISEIADAARSTIDVAISGAKAVMPLTAGNETRALLSLVRGRQEKFTFFTGSFPGAVVDLGVARRLSRQFGLFHVITLVQARTKEEIQDWRLRTGHCIGGAICYSKMDRENIADCQIEFSGAAGEVGRGFLWDSADKADDNLTSDVLLARLKLPLIDRFVGAVDKWLSSVRQFDAFTMMDLAYIELKMACWAGPQTPGTDTSASQIWPLSSRRCFTAMMSAPIQVRQDQSLFSRLVQTQWPELLEVPINRGTSWENLQKLLYRASSPQRVWNKVRKSLAKIKRPSESE